MTMSLLGVGVVASAQATTVATRVVAPSVELPRGAHVLGPERASSTTKFDVFLVSRDARGLSRLAASVTDPHSLSYRHYLARGQFARRYGASPSVVAKVSAALRADGLHVEGNLVDGLGLRVSGTTGTVESALSTSIEQVRLAGGSLGTRTTDPVRLPASIAADVTGIVGLDDLVHATSSTIAPTSHVRQPTEKGIGRNFSESPSGVAGSPSSCAPATDATQEGYGGITDDQVANAYGVEPLYADGDFASTQTIAVYELEPFALSDVATFDECYFGTDNTSNIDVLPIDGGPGVGYGSGEAALDVENVSALAPEAHIDVYSAPNSVSGALDAYGAIVSDDVAKVVTTSWGECEADMVEYAPGSLDVEHLLFEQAAAQGQTVFAAAGDDGDDDCAGHASSPVAPYLSVDDPASQPYVVGVGGTTAISMTDPPVEQVWNDGAQGGASGGGISGLWAAPAWQSDNSQVKAVDTVSTCGTGHQLCRVVPDVSAFADEYTGITIVYGGTWGTIGGTSSAAPIWAALLAEINGSNACTAQSVTRDGVGFASPLLYQVGANPTTYAESFNDVTQGNNDLFGIQNGLYEAATGYDAASGLGTPDLSGPHGTGLAATLCAAAQQDTTESLSSVSPTSGTTAGGTLVVITGTGFETGSTSNVTGVSFGDVPAASFRVTSSTSITAVTAPQAQPRALKKLVPSATEQDVTVLYKDGRAAVGPEFRYTTVGRRGSLPTVLSVGPSGGPTTGGNTVRIYGTGFTGATAVDFGGVPATSYTVESDSLIDAVAPAETATRCLAASHTVLTGLCQSQVTVRTASGVSPVDTILKPFVGTIKYSESGIPYVTANCHCELFPVLTEYDYQATPTITSVENRTVIRDEPLVSPSGGNEIEIRGSGFNWIGIDDIAVGDPTQAANQDYNIERVTSTMVFAYAPSDPDPSPSGDKAPLVVQTEGGNSTAGTLDYGGVPMVTGLSEDVLPSSGGVTLTLTGLGFGTSTSDIEDVNFLAPFSNTSDTVLANFSVVSPTEIKVLAPSLVPGNYVISVDNVYGDSLLYTQPVGQTPYSYETLPLTTTGVDVAYPGQAALTVPSSVTVATPAGGGTITVSGINFGSDVGAITAYVGGVPTTVSDLTSVDGIDSVSVAIPPAPEGLAGIYAVVLSTPNGTTAETLDAYVDYGITYG